MRDVDAPRLLSIAELARAVDMARPDRSVRGRKLGRPLVEPNTELLGGKAARLVWLLRHGFRVPEGKVLPADVFEAVARDVLPPGHDLRSLLRLAGTREGVERAGRAHARLREARLPSWLEAELAWIWDELSPRAPWGLAVRSSANCEDSAGGSLAGLATTRLGVRGPEALADAVREVWASTTLPRALSYLAERNVSSISMAVIFQVVVPSRASGVAVTAAPPLGPERVFADGASRSIEVLVNATHGLGAPVVAGTTTPDVLRLEVAVSRAPDEDPPLAPRVLSATIAQKPRALVVGAAGPEAIELPSARRGRPALGEKSTADLARALGRLVALGPGPWEVEFAVEGDPNQEGEGALSLLQARPVVELGMPAGGEESTVWSCANLAEALPGVATPLTWSVAANFSELGFRRAFAALGAVVPRGTRLVANVHGRFYLNLTAFMRVAATVPGLDPVTLLELGGGSGTDLLRAQVEGVSTRGFWARLPITASRAIGEQLRLDDELERYERDAGRVRSAFEALDLGILTDDGVATTLRDLGRFLDRTGALMLTCASGALGSFVALRALLSRAACAGDRAEATRLAGDLTAGGAGKGYGDLESARPTIALVRIAEIALADPPAREALARAPTRVEDLPPGPTRDAFERWVVAYGARAIREAELATPRWREDPSFPLATLALYVARAASGQPASPNVAEVHARAAAALESIDRRAGLAARTAVRHLVARSQKLARHRERMRAWVTWVLGAIRTSALEADRRLRRREPKFAATDGEIPSVFFCTFDEILAALRGEPRPIERVVTMRRAEYARDRARPEPPTTFVGRPGPLDHEATGARLEGHAASAGVVRGPARILESPEQASRLRPGEILVTRTTDVGWTPLFLAAAGVVTELGGPLSHAAIVARELGVPCVVNVEGALGRLRDGDRILLDGDRGTIDLESPDAPAPGERPRVEAP